MVRRTWPSERRTPVFAAFCNGRQVLGVGNRDDDGWPLDVIAMEGERGRIAPLANLDPDPEDDSRPTAVWDWTEPFGCPSCGKKHQVSGKLLRAEFKAGNHRVSVDAVCNNV